jgi:hypothetical protein
MPLVDVGNLRKFLRDQGQITFRNAVSGFVLMVIEVGNGIADGYPGDLSRFRRRSNEYQRKKKQNFFHQCLRDLEIS